MGVAQQLKETDKEREQRVLDEHKIKPETKGCCRF